MQKKVVKMLGKVGIPLDKENHMTIRFLHWWVKQDIGEGEYGELLKDLLANELNKV